MSDGRRDFIGGKPWSAPLVAPDHETRMERCEECRGSGVVEYIDVWARPCDVCHGDGEYMVVYCGHCSAGASASAQVYHRPPACK